MVYDFGGHPHCLDLHDRWGLLVATFQPFQGFFANVISPHKKDYFGFLIPL
jgi:hypothetical protein